MRIFCEGRTAKLWPKRFPTKPLTNTVAHVTLVVNRKFDLLLLFFLISVEIANGGWWGKRSGVSDSFVSDMVWRKKEEECGRDNINRMFCQMQIARDVRKLMSSGGVMYSVGSRNEL